MPKPIKNFHEHFLARFKPGENGCLNWTGALYRNGYGKTRVPGTRKLDLAHRVAWRLQRGEIPHGRYLLHSCDNKRCGNVEHLRAGGHQENMADVRLRGRGRVSAHAAACHRGHPMTPENRRVSPRGYIHCRRCLGDYS